jgi:hypothetical protein
VILAPSEIQQLTGYVRPSAQVRWLRRHGWRHVVNAKGRPVVARAERNRHLPLPVIEAPAILSPDELRELPRHAHRCGGVYFLWRDQDLLYVGHTWLFGQRIGSHEFAGRIPFTWCTFIVCDDKVAREDLEAAYIRAYRPPYNRK